MNYQNSIRNVIKERPVNSGSSVNYGSSVKGRIYPIVDELQALGFKPSSVDTGKHNVGSLHGQGRAVDLGINTTFGGDNKKMENFLENVYPKLKQKYPGLKLHDERNHPKGQAVWSGSHFHLEY